MKEANDAHSGGPEILATPLDRSALGMNGATGIQESLCHVKTDNDYLIGRGDFDQCVHLVQTTTIFPPWHTVETDSVCILVGQKFNVAPHRHFVKLGEM